MPTFISLPLKHFVSALLLGLPLTAAAQLPSPAGVPDSLPVTARPSTLRRATYWAGQPANQRVLIPAILFTAGALTTRRVAVVNSDNEVREELNEHVVPVRTTIDDELRHVPAAVALGLSLAGVKGQHSTVNQALLFALTYTINNTLTSNLKNLTRVERPGNNGDFSSFPSQHTSAAFAAATFMHREYGGRSVWYSIGGYSVATATAAIRVLGNKHWASDVLAGAGVGILSTELAYWAYPLVHRVLVRGLQDRAMVAPFYSGGAVGLVVGVPLR